MVAGAIVGIAALLFAAALVRRRTESPADSTHAPTPAARAEASPSRSLDTVRGERTLPARTNETRPAATPRTADSPSAEIDDLERATVLLRDGDPYERIGAVAMLAAIEGPESLQLLLDAISDPAAEVRLQAVLALRSRPEEPRPAWLVPALRDSDPHIRLEALMLLGDLGTPEALELAREALADTDEEVRSAAEGIVGLEEAAPDPDAGE